MVRTSQNQPPTMDTGALDDLDLDDMFAEDDNILFEGLDIQLDGMGDIIGGSHDNVNSTTINSNKKDTPPQTTTKSSTGRMGPRTKRPPPTPPSKRNKPADTDFDLTGDNDNDGTTTTTTTRRRKTKRKTKTPVVFGDDDDDEEYMDDSISPSLSSAQQSSSSKKKSRKSAAAAAASSNKRAKTAASGLTSATATTPTTALPLPSASSATATGKKKKSKKGAAAATTTSSSAATGGGGLVRGTSGIVAAAGQFGGRTSKRASGSAFAHPTGIPKLSKRSSAGGGITGGAAGTATTPSLKSGGGFSASTANSSSITGNAALVPSAGSMFVPKPESTHGGLHPSKSYFYPFMEGIPPEPSMKNRKQYAVLDKISSALHSHLNNAPSGASLPSTATPSTTTPTPNTAPTAPASTISSTSLPSSSLTSPPPQSATSSTNVNAKTQGLPPLPPGISMDLPIVQLLLESFEAVSEKDKISFIESNKRHALLTSIPELRKTISSLEHTRLLGDLYAMCGLLSRQFHFLTTSLQNMEAWCQQQFTEAEYRMAYSLPEPFQPEKVGTVITSANRKWKKSVITVKLKMEGHYIYFNNSHNNTTATNDREVVISTQPPPSSSSAAMTATTTKGGSAAVSPSSIAVLLAALPSGVVIPGEKKREKEALSKKKKALKEKAALAQTGTTATTGGAAGAVTSIGAGSASLVKLSKSYADCPPQERRKRIMERVASLALGLESQLLRRTRSATTGTAGKGDNITSSISTKATLGEKMSSPTSKPSSSSANSSANNSNKLESKNLAAIFLSEDEPLNTVRMWEWIDAAGFYDNNPNKSDLQLQSPEINQRGLFLPIPTRIQGRSYLNRGGQEQQQQQQQQRHPEKAREQMSSSSENGPEREQSSNAFKSDPTIATTMPEESMEVSNNSLFDRLQSLLVVEEDDDTSVVDKYMRDEDSGSENDTDDDSVSLRLLEEDSDNESYDSEGKVKIQNGTIPGNTGKKSVMYDLSKFSLDERTFLHLCSIGLIRQSVFPKVELILETDDSKKNGNVGDKLHTQSDARLVTTSTLVEDDEFDDEQEDDLVNVIGEMSSDLSELTVRNNARLQFLESAMDPSDIAFKKEQEEEQANLIAKCQTLLRRHKEKSKKNSRQKNSRKDDLNLPW